MISAALAAVVAQRVHAARAADHHEREHDVVIPFDPARADVDAAGGPAKKPTAVSLDLALKE